MRVISQAGQTDYHIEAAVPDEPKGFFAPLLLFFMQEAVRVEVRLLQDRPCRHCVGRLIEELEEYYDTDIRLPKVGKNFRFWLDDRDEGMFLADAEIHRVVEMVEAWTKRCKRRHLPVLTTV